MSATHKRMLILVIIIFVFLTLLFCLPISSTAYSYSEFNVYIEQGCYGELYIEKRSLLDYAATAYGNALEIPIDYEHTGMNFFFLGNDLYEYRIGSNPYQPLLSGETYLLEIGYSAYIRKKPIISEMFTVNFYCSDQKVKTQQVEKNSSATAPQPTSMEGYSFSCWDTDFSSVTSNLEINAVYTINTYKVEFFVNSEKEYEQTVEYDSLATQYIPDEMEHYTFTPFTKQGETIAFNFFFPIKEDTKLYCDIVPVSYTISFYLDGDWKYSQQVVYNTSVTKYLPDKPHYIISDYLDIDGLLYDFNSKITGDISLYATSSPEIYFVSFFVDDVLIETSEVEYNHKAICHIPEEIPHYSYSLYKENNVIFDFDTPITKNTDLYSISIPDTYQVDFYIDGEVEKTEFVVYPGFVTEYLCQKEHYTISDYKQNGSEEPFDFATPISFHTSLYAVSTPNTYTVQFFVDSSPQPQHKEYVIYNNKVVEYKPIKPLYIINPFQYRNGDIFDFDTPITGDIDLYCTTLANFYTVSFYDNNLLINVDIEKNKQVTPVEPSNINNDFIGWQKADSNMNFDFSLPITENISLYALYQSELIEVTFDLDGGTAEGETFQLVKKGFAAVLPAEISKKGYIFLGWQGDNTNIQSPTQIKALFKIETYTVEFRAYGNIVAEWINITYGDCLTGFPDHFTLTVGDEVLYWHRGDHIAFLIGQTITENLTLCAEIGKISYQINLHFLETINTIILKHGSQLLRPTIPECDEGYYFENWYNQQEFLSEFAFNGYVYGNIDIYGKQELISLQITFVVFVEEDLSFCETVKYGETVTCPTLETTGYSLLWYSDNNYTSLFEFSLPLISDTSIYGKASPNEYIINFDCSEYDDLSLQTLSFYYLEDIALPEINYYGYTLNCFLFEEKPFELAKMPAYSLTLKPCFTTMDFELSFDQAESLVDAYHSTVTLPSAPILEWYYFDGWLDENNILHNNTYKILGNMSFTAKYKIIGTLSIHYENESLPFICQYGDTIDPPQPEKDGFVFLGWYRDSAFSTSFNNIATVSEGDVLYLFPKWVNATQTITFIYFDAEIKYIVNFGDQSPSIDGIDINGYDFIGWFFDEEFLSPYENIFLENDCIVYAKYEKKLFTVTFVGLNNRVISTQHVLFLESAVLPENGILEEGYDFEGFENGYDEISADIVILANYIPQIETPPIIEALYFDAEGNPLENNIAPEIEGFTFEGWELVQNGNSFMYYAVYSPLTSHPPIEDPEITNPPTEEQLIIDQSPIVEGTADTNESNSNSNLALLIHSANKTEFLYVLFSLVILSFAYIPITKTLKKKNKL